MPRSLTCSTLAVFLVTAVVWIAGLWDYTFYTRDFWFYVVLFRVPGGLVCISAWLIFMDRIWARVLGVLLVLPSLAIWVLSLLLAYGKFRIH